MTLPDFIDTTISGSIMKWEVIMPDITRHQFADEFKSEAVWLTRESGGRWPKWQGSAGTD